jgi:hypothetical protein
MAAEKRTGDGTGGQPRAAGEADALGGARGPESVGPWGTVGELEAVEPHWGAPEESPMGEGSEPTAVPPGLLGERRAGPDGRGRTGPAGRHGFGTAEPTRVPEAGPGGAPDPAPPRRPFPDEAASGDLPDNPLERQTGMRPEGVQRDR